MPQKTTGDILRENLAMYEDLVSNIPGGVYRFRMKASGGWAFDFVNRAFCELTGLNREDVLNDYETAFRIIHPDDLNTFISLNKSLEKTLAPFIWEGRAIVHGKTRWMSAESRSTLMDNGDIVWNGYFADITNRKRAEQELRNFQTIADQANYGCALHDLQGYLIYVNEAFASMHGFSSQELIGKNLSVFHNDKQMEHVNELLEGLKRDGTFEFQEVWHVKKDGTAFLTLMSASVIRDLEGAPLFMSATAIDISVRKRAEERLRKVQLELEASRNNYRDLYDFAPVGYFTLTQKGVITEVNMMGATLFGTPCSKLVGLGFEHFIAPENLDLWYQHLLEARLEGVTQSQDFWLKRQDGSSCCVSLESLCMAVPSGRRSENNGAQVIRVAVTDITERKRTAEALRQSEEKFRRIIETANEGFWSMDEVHTTTSVNKKMSDMLGYNVDEMIGKKVENFMFADEIQEHEKRMAERYHGLVGFYEKRLRRKDGTTLWTLVSATALIDQDGAFKGSFALFTDITERKRIEDELIRSEERFRSMFERHGAVMLLIEPKTGRIIAANRAAERFYGYTNAQMRSMFIQDINVLSPDVVESERNLALHEHRNYFVFPHRLANGEVRTVEAHSTPIEENGNPILFSVIHDITDRERAKEALRESEQFLRQSEKITRIGGWRANPFTNRLYWTEGVYEILEAPRDYFPNFEEGGTFFVPEHRPMIREAIENLLNHGNPFKLEAEILTSSGKRRWTEMRGLMREEEGEEPQVVGSFQDITERKKSEEKNQRLAAIVDSSDDAIIGNTLGGNVTSWNKGAERIFGYREHEVIGKSISILAPNDLKYEPENFLKQIKSGRSVKNVETVRQRKDGAKIPVCLTVSPIIDEKGGVVGASAIVRDISDRVRAEQQREALQSQFFQAQKMEAVGILAGGVAHDFNNLLQAVIGYSELLLDQKKPGDPELEDIQRIYDSGQRGADLVKSLLMFSRKVKPELRPIDLNHEIAQVQKLLSHSIPKTINIDLRLSEALERVLADPSQTGQVIMNLAINARDAMPDGGTLTIETANVELDKAYCAIHPELSPGAYVLLTVSDTGQGMEKETLSHIFEPFFTTKEKGKGTGLGLATVYGIVKQHNGHITCHGELGHGTAFEIYLPAIQTDRAPETQTEAGPIKRGTETILIVDDEEAIRDFGTRLLNKFGYKVVTANDGKEALERYQSEVNSISLVILDLIMPVMDGKKCLTEILRVNPNAKVVLASGYSESGLASGATTGARGFVKKPYDMWQLLTKIREILDAD